MLIMRLGFVKAQTVLPPKQEDATPTDPRPLIPPGSDPLLLLQSPDAEQRDNATVLLLRDHENMEDKVQAVAEVFLKQSAQRRLKNPAAANNQIGNQDDHGAKNAIGVLGEFRSTRSVPFLVDHLTLPVFDLHSENLGDAYPCAGALVSIGSPSLDPLLVKVEQTDDPETIKLAAYVFVKTLGKDVGTCFIEDRRGKLRDTAAKSYLEQLAHEVRTQQFPY